ncbi:MAG: YggS family pyridoxal phosphate-dependent enzyme [Proteobacteria bacterium]|nr:YggS family pyridoxal phosphate-dependent enzyme [Pseudomonadota bacterium]MBU1545839.1 YggS family pyridoxal phosphate-dependent enzyme [Pseudomonadota bacterium]MBU2618673.1 YggS family pyridoxal phosphate-dependent enzyme [Pseudomonadota bacterium]
MGMVAENIEAIRARMRGAAERVGRDPDSVRLVAVSKRQSLEVIREAMACGQTVFGENYLQEAEEKVAALGQGLAWHCIGHLQSNKARIAAEIFDCIETIDRLKLAKALEIRLAELGKTMPVLVQINVGGEAQKAGVTPEEAGQLCRELQQFPHLRLQGLMTMPPFFEDPEESRGYFRRLRLLGDELAAQGLLGRHGMVQLSMGMSGDFEVAIEEGATLVRVGTALFGER